MIALVVLLFAAVCAGLFCGAAVYINFVEHPARVSCGSELAVREFAPSYRRATVMQASLAGAGTILGLIAAWALRDRIVALGAICLGAVIPYTLIVLFPTNKLLLDPGLEAHSGSAAALLARWNRLHAVRSILSGAGFVLMLWSLAMSSRR